MTHQRFDDGRVAEIESTSTLEIDVDDTPRFVSCLVIKIARSRSAATEEENVVAFFRDVYPLTKLVVECDRGDGGVGVG